MNAHLDAGKPIRDLPLSEEDKTLISGYRFLTQKPLLIVLNVEEASVSEPPPPAIADHAAKRGLGLVVLSAKVEQDIAQMPPADQKDFVARSRPRRAGARSVRARGVLAAVAHQLPHRG